MIRELLLAAPRTFRLTWRRFVAVEILFKAVGAILAASASAIVLSRIVARTGSTAVTNADLVGFLVRPGPLAFLGVVLTAALFLIVAEHGALLVLARPGTVRQGSLADQVRGAMFAVFRIARLTVLLVAVILAITVPATGLLAAIYFGLLSGHDINFYLATRPPKFLAALALGGIVAAAAASLLLALLVRWIFAIPIALFEGIAPYAALRASRDRVRGIAWRVAGILIGWHGGIFLAGSLAVAGHRLLARWTLEAASGSTAAAVSTIAVLLALQGLGAALGSFFAVAGNALIVLHLYLDRRPPRDRDAGAEPLAATDPAAPAAHRSALLVGVAGTILLAAFVVPAFLLVSQIGKSEKIAITAHRGCSRIAPENTLSAVRRAIEAGADWAEIDVQETADGAVVVLHDRDLMRMAGDPRRIAELTLAEVRKLDVGAKFDPAFAGERLATLEEMIDLARGRIKLNIELKYYGEDPRLAPDVVRILREKKFEGECVVASLDFPSLQKVREENRPVRTAAIVTVRMGDPLRLPTDVLSMNARFVTKKFLDAAHRRGKEILVWTIDDPKLADRLMEIGVDNIITNNPAALLRLRAERRSLSRAERLILAARYYLGISTGESSLESASIPEL